MRRIAFLLMSIYCFTACNNELDYLPVDPEEGKNPPIELILPDANMVNVYSTATASENTIDTLWVIIFNGNTKRWGEKIEGSKIVRNGNASQLLPQLKNKPNNGDVIVCIANVDPNPDTTTVTLATINNCFKLDVNGYYYGTERLPMYGSFTWSDMGGTICLMRRAVAKIQVQMGTSVSDVTTNFTAQNVYYRLYYGAKGGYISPTTPLSGKQTTQPMHSPELYRMLQHSGATEQNSNIYLYEYQSATDALTQSVLPSKFHANRQHILLYKVNGVNDTSYYRLDFYDKVTQTYIDTKRNHHYLFTIDKVRSEGYKSSSEAIANPGSNIEYTIKVTDRATDVVSNGQYAIVLNMDSVIRKNIMTSNCDAGVVKYQLPPEMLADLPSWTTSPNSISIQTLTKTPITASDLIITPSSMTSNEQTIVIGSTGSPIIEEATAIITFKLGNIIYEKRIRIAPVIFL